MSRGLGRRVWLVPLTLGLAVVLGGWGGRGISWDARRGGVPDGSLLLDGFGGSSRGSGGDVRSDELGECHLRSVFGRSSFGRSSRGGGGAVMRGFTGNP